MKRNSKLLTGALAIIMTLMLFTGMAAAATTLQDGEYTIDAKAVNSSNGTPSMADTYIQKPVKLQVEGSKINVLLTMAESDIMTDLAAPDSTGSYIAAEIVAANKAANEKTYKFSVAGIDEPVTLEVVVAAMGRTVNFNLEFDKATLVSTTQKPAAESPSASTPIANPKTGDNGLNAGMAVVGLAAIASAITYIVYKR